jgi:hypothetical protein
VFWFSLKFYSKTFFILRRNERNPLFLSGFNETLIFSKDFRKILKYQILRKFFHWEPRCSMQARLTSITKLIVTLRNLANAPRIGWYFSLPSAPVPNTHIQSHTIDIKQSRPAFQNLTRTLHRLQILTNSVGLLRKITLNRRPLRQSRRWKKSRNVLTLRKQFCFLHTSADAITKVHVNIVYYLWIINDRPRRYHIIHSALTFNGAQCENLILLHFLAIYTLFYALLYEIWRFQILRNTNNQTLIILFSNIKCP